MLKRIKSFFSDESRKEGARSETRRDFMKTLAMGTVATGAYITIPTASAFSISSENPVQFFNSTSNDPNLQINTSGETDLKGNNLVNTNRIEASEVNLSGSNNNGKTIVYDSELDSMVVVDE